MRPLAGPETLCAFIFIHVGCLFGTVSNVQICEEALVGGALALPCNSLMSNMLLNPFVNYSPFVMSEIQAWAVITRVRDEKLH